MRRLLPAVALALLASSASAQSNLGIAQNSPNISPAATPEPGVVGLMVAGLISGSVLLRRRKKA